MDQLLNFLGNAAGILGALVCAVMGLARLGGFFFVAGFEATALFNVGVGLMVFACLVKLEQIRQQGSQ